MTEIFIKKYKINNSVCKNLIDFYEDNTHRQVEGTIGNNVVEKETKQCTEMYFTINEPIIVSYLNELENCVNEYKNAFEELNSIASWSIVEKIKIQKYKPGEAFYKWHYENDGQKNSISSRRLLAFMTYLNTIDNGGETQWKYQKIETKAVQGDTLIWPVDWTHTHKGCISNNEIKYIITGWYSFNGN